MIAAIKNFDLEKAFAELSLNKILLLAFVTRIVAALFSTGYAMHDDHFNVIEVAQSWADGKNIGNWLPNALHTDVVRDTAHSLFYPGIHYLLFCFFNFIGLHDPQIKMVFVRLMHAIYSLLVVYYAYKITEKLSNIEHAKLAALLLGLLWFMPNLSVRNLIEMVCIPPLLAAIYLLIKNEIFDWKKYLLSGFIIGFAFSIRFQTALFIGGVGLALLLQKQWRGFIFYSIGFLINVFIFQCISDVCLWGYPLAEFWGYVQCNIHQQSDFVAGHWFTYSLLVTGLALPPFSILLWLGYFKNVKNNLLIFLPSFLFLVFHSFFVNQQERFILPFVPLFIIGGLSGLNNWRDYLPVAEKQKRILRATFIIVVTLNILLLTGATVASTKTSRMNALYFLYERKDTRAYIIESSYADGWQFFPQFYLGKWCNEYFIPKGENAMNLKNKIVDVQLKPKYVIFLSDKDLAQRIENFEQAYPNIEPVATIQPSFVDRLFFKLNPVNKNEPCFIYKIND